MIFDLIEWFFDIIFNAIYNLFRKKDSDTYNYTYVKKDLITKYEYYFYNIFKELENEFDIVIMPQIPLCSIVKKINFYKTPNELYRIIDFGVFTKDYKDLLLLIEINDKTHNTKKRQYRDKKVRNICNIANIRLITYYSNMPNEKNYVKDRLRKEIINILNVNKM